jgi:hypothetical protein
MSLQVGDMVSKALARLHFPAGILRKPVIPFFTFGEEL